MTGEKGFQTAGFHLLRQDLKALFQLVQHGIVVFLGSHLADGHHVIPGGDHFFIALNLAFRLLGLHGHLLAFFRIIPEARSLLHCMKTLQLIAKPGQIQ